MKSDGTQVPKSEIQEFTDKKLGIEQDNTEDLQISQETIRYLTRLGLRCTHLGVNDSSSNGNILGYLDI